MSGGVVQLVAVGPQDAWLTGKPEVSFYRSNYKRYTHYSSSVERQVIQGAPIANGISTIRFEKKGDLLSYVYLTARDNNGAGIVGLDWSKVIDKVELYIGGQIVDTHDFEYMSDIEPIVGARTYSERYLNSTSTTLNNQKNSFFPLKFFFCKEWSVALPLIGLQFHDVELRITWSPYLTQNITIGPTSYPVLSVPNGSINVFSVSQGTLAFSNTANLVVSQTTGPLFPGMLLTSATSNLQANVVVIQGFSANTTPTLTSNIAFSNIIIAGSNTGIINATSIFSTSIGGALRAYAPVVSAELSVAIAAGTALSTTKDITLTEISSFNGTGSLAVGQYVAGVPWAGPVFVSSTSNIANSNVTVTYPSQRTGPVLAGTTIAFFTGTSNTNTSYSQVQYQAWSNFVYLDQSERDFFAKEKQDLLITQVQRIVMGTNPVQELALAQPVKFIAFPCVNYQPDFRQRCRLGDRCQLPAQDAGERRGCRGLPPHVPLGGSSPVLQHPLGLHPQQRHCQRGNHFLLPGHLQAPAHRHPQLLPPRQFPPGCAFNPAQRHPGSGKHQHQLPHAVPVRSQLQRVPHPERSRLAALRQLNADKLCSKIRKCIGSCGRSLFV